MVTMVAVCLRMRAEMSYLLDRAAASCCCRLLIRLTVSLSAFLAEASCVPAYTFWLVRLLMDCRLAIRLRLRLLRSVLAEL